MPLLVPQPWEPQPYAARSPCRCRQAAPALLGQCSRPLVDAIGQPVLTEALWRLGEVLALTLPIDHLVVGLPVALAGDLGFAIGEQFHITRQDDLHGRFNAPIGFRQCGFGLSRRLGHCLPPGLRAGFSGKFPLNASSQDTSTLDTELATMKKPPTSVGWYCGRVTLCLATVGHAPVFSPTCCAISPGWRPTCLWQDRAPFGSLGFTPLRPLRYLHRPVSLHLSLPAPLLGSGPSGRGYVVVNHHV